MCCTSHVPASRDKSLRLSNKGRDSNSESRLLEADQLKKICSMFGVATEYNWPGVSELPKYQDLMPKAEIKGAFKDTFRNEDPHAVMLLEKMLTLDPSQRISAKDALEHDFFRVEPLPSKLTSLKGESSLQLAVTRRRRKGKLRRAI